jgi:hypothetical protein
LWVWIVTDQLFLKHTLAKEMAGRGSFEARVLWSGKKYTGNQQYFLEQM